VEVFSFLLYILRIFRLIPLKKDRAMVKSDFNFEKINDSTYLITNYAGRYAFLNEKDFQAFLSGGDFDNEKRLELENAYFCSSCNSEHYS
jgi:hypothetical protein